MFYSSFTNCKCVNKHITEQLHSNSNSKNFEIEMNSETKKNTLHYSGTYALGVKKQRLL